MLDVGALLEDAENRGGVLEHVDELQEHNVQVGIEESEWLNGGNVVAHYVKSCWSSVACVVLQLSARLQEIENQTADRITELETQLMQATKEAELLKVSAAFELAKEHM